MNTGRALRYWCAPFALATAALTMPPAAADSDVVFTDREIDTLLRMSPLKPKKLLDPTNTFCGNMAAQRFGRALFFDKRLSSNESESCATCHDPQAGWAGGDDVERSGHKAGRHTPSLWNVAYYRWYNWDGSTDSLWAQALGPIENEQELANNRVGIARTIQRDSDLREAYVELFGAIPASIAPGRLPVSGRPVPREPDHPDHRRWLSMSADQREEVTRVFVNVGKAIAVFEATIVSANAPFDRFVEGLRADHAGKLSAISPQAKRGLKLFLGKGKCVLCHSGPNFSDGEFHNVFLDSRADSDLGRWSGIDRLRQSEFNALSTFNDGAPGETERWVEYVVRSPETKSKFKTPTLRNIRSSAPYMHTGELETLDDVLDHYDGIGKRMDKEQRHIELVLSELTLSKAQKRDLIAFLYSLTDEGYLEQGDVIANR
jgi:cytochrome c peroxidase